MLFKSSLFTVRDNISADENGRSGEYPGKQEWREEERRNGWEAIMSRRGFAGIQ